jgi:hypothetical protein
VLQCTKIEILTFYESINSQPYGLTCRFEVKLFLSYELGILHALVKPTCFMISPLILNPDKPELNIDPSEAERFVVSLRSVFFIKIDRIPLRAVGSTLRAGSGAGG